MKKKDHSQFTERECFSHRGEKGSAGAYTKTLLVIDRDKGVGVHPPTSPGWAKFTNMMECTPEKWSLPVNLYSLVCGFCNIFNSIIVIVKKTRLEVI